jgi:2-(3-amino-3-carboxypropyl)histidine synthase
VDRAPLTAGSSFDLDLDLVLEKLRSRKAGKVGLQAPEGLKRLLPEIAELISDQTKAEVVISGDPCYGACDLDLSLAEEVDVLLHLGHADLNEQPEKVIFVEVRMKEDLTEAVKNAASLLQSKRVGLSTTVQHAHKLDQALQILKERGIDAQIGGSCGRAKYPGQVLGCSYCTARSLDVEEYLFIGTGRFHPLGIALATGKRVIAADPVTGEAAMIDPETLLRQRFSSIARAWDEKRFAVLVSKKPGQRRWETARLIKELGESRGKEMFLIYLDNVEPDRLLNLGFPAAVSTACPRVALDDAAKYDIPILTPPEFEIMVGKRAWEDYAFDEIQ